MGKFIDLTGHKYGKLEVLKQSNKENNRICWQCKCECGAIKNVSSNSLRKGNTKSCGCAQLLAVTKHGASNGLRKCHALYTIWKSMTRRCRDPNYEQYKNYGGRGIRVCKEWRTSYEKFRDYMIALPGCPKNVQTWNKGNKLEKSIEQMNNRRKRS